MRAWLCRSAILAIVLAIAVLVPFGKILGAQASDLSPDLTPSRADLTEVNVASLGFDPEDSTQYIQAAIDSGVARVVVPNMGQDWIVRPLVLRSNLELIFEEGVVLTAKKGEYRGTR